jgi:signal transduction histidine kinase
VQIGRTAALENAKSEVGRRLAPIAEQLAANWRVLRRGALRPMLYRVPPAPAASGKPQQLFEQALAVPPNEVALQLARLAAEHRDDFASSGLPLLPLVEWARLRLEKDPAELQSRAQELARAAVATHPSILTPELLANSAALLRSRGADASSLTAWTERWEEEEAAREALRVNNALLAAAGAPLWIQSPRGTWWAERESSAVSPSLLSQAEIEAVAETVVSNASSLLPDYAAVNLALGGRPLLKVSPIGEVLATVEAEGFELTALLAKPEQLYAQQRQQTLWLSALLACAFVGALAAFWAMQRAVMRERQLGALKSNFVASVSHELRAPVASMRLMAENLESDRVPEPERRDEYHRLIAEECRRLSALIENVLDFARIEQQRKVYDFAETDVVALARDAIQLMQPRARQRRQEIHAELETIHPPPCCDGLAVRQALINLLDNAIKFSPERTPIDVRLAARESGSWQLSVSDQGPGIPAAEHEKIFERFYRIGSELRRETQGAGIGLAIVKHITDAHAGRVTVTNEPDAGATFTLTFPLIPPSGSNPSPCPAS